MKKIKFLLPLIFLFQAIQAQKIGVVDTNYILGKLPQYKEAEGRLNGQIKNWETEIQRLQKEYDTKKSAFENEKVLLVGDQLKDRQKELDDLDTRIKDLVAKRFGANGEVVVSRSNLTKPFQDQIWNAVNTVVEKNNLGIVLDKSNNISVIFLDPKYDYTDKVLDILLKNQPKESKEDKIKTNGRSATPGRSLRAPAGKSSALETTQSMKKVAK
ncbi:OmpH family outer membrane protein [Weeksellaceae bacterium A-14]|uniref:OmpH family outer membrane protein n=1 Tax=Daejeonia sp. YH14 TaxID=3439042 RepID=UPI0031E4C461